MALTGATVAGGDLSKVRVPTFVVTTDYLISINIAIWCLGNKGEKQMC